MDSIYGNNQLDNIQNSNQANIQANTPLNNQPNTEQPKGKRSHTVLIILLVILALMMSAGSASVTYYFMDKNLKNQKNDLEFKIFSLNQDNENIKKELDEAKEKLRDKDETENWKTYSDNKYGYSIKYPADYRCDPASEVILKCWPNDYTVRLRTVDSISFIQIAIYSEQVPEYAPFAPTDFEKYEKGGNTFLKLKTKNDMYITKGSLTYRISIEQEQKEHPVDFSDVYRTMISTFKM